MKISEIVKMEKYAEDTYLPVSSEEKCVFKYGVQIGRNVAIDELSTKEVRVDIERLASKIKSYSTNSLQIDFSSYGAEKLAEAISKALPEILTVKQGEIK